MFIIVKSASVPISRQGKRGFVWCLVMNTLLRRSGIARVLKRSRSFTCTPAFIC